MQVALIQARSLGVPCFVSVGGFGGGFVAACHS